MLKIRFTCFAKYFSIKFKSNETFSLHFYASTVNRNVAQFLYKQCGWEKFVQKMKGKKDHFKWMNYKQKKNPLSENMLKVFCFVHCKQKLLSKDEQLHCRNAKKRYILCDWMPVFCAESQTYRYLTSLKKE